MLLSVVPFLLNNKPQFWVVTTEPDPFFTITPLILPTQLVGFARHRPSGLLMAVQWLRQETLRRGSRQSGQRAAQAGCV